MNTIISKEILNCLENPQTENEIVNIIRAYLLTEKQRTVLFNLNLSIEDCLNGRYGEKEEVEIYKIYQDWNKKCGQAQFGAW